MAGSGTFLRDPLSVGVLPWQYDFSNVRIEENRLFRISTPIVKATFTNLTEREARDMARSFAEKGFGGSPCASFNDDLGCWQVSLGVREQERSVLEARGVGFAASRDDVPVMALSFDGASAIPRDKAYDVKESAKEVLGALRGQEGASDLRESMQILIKDLNLLQRGSLGTIVTQQRINDLAQQVTDNFGDSQIARLAAREMQIAAGIDLGKGMEF